MIRSSLLVMDAFPSGQNCLTCAASLKRGERQLSTCHLGPPTKSAVSHLFLVGGSPPTIDRTSLLEELEVHAREWVPLTFRTQTLPVDFGPSNSQRDPKTPPGCSMEGVGLRKPKLGAFEEASDVS